jgi:hypothetical protein
MATRSSRRESLFFWYDSRVRTGGQHEEGQILVKIARVALILLCFTALFLVCFGPALFKHRQFGFRDAGHYYYPLHERVQRE